MPSDIEFAAIKLSGSVAVRVDSENDLTHAFDLLGLTKRAVLVLVGGAGGMNPAGGDERVRNFFFEVLAPLAESCSAIVIDGGTDTGVMRLMGEARFAIGGNFPLLGIAAIDTVLVPKCLGTSKGSTALEPHHSHFLMVPGQRWGDESPWIARAACLLSIGFRSLTVVVNGGEITLLDIACSIRERRPIVVLSGSGRSADRLARGLNGGSQESEIQALLASGLIQAVDIDRDPQDLMRAMASCLIA